MKNFWGQVEFSLKKPPCALTLMERYSVALGQDETGQWYAALEKAEEKRKLYAGPYKSRYTAAYEALKEITCRRLFGGISEADIFTGEQELREKADGGRRESSQDDHV